MGSIYLSIGDQLDDHITSLAEERGVKKSDLLRDLLESGLASQQVKQDLAIVERERDGLKVKVSDLEREHSEFMASMEEKVKAYYSRLDKLEQALRGTQDITIERLKGYGEAIEKLQKAQSEKPPEALKISSESIGRHLPECKDCRESAFEALEPFMKVQDVETCVDCHKPYEPKTVEEGLPDLATGELQKKQVCIHCGSDSTPKEEASQIVLLESPRKEEAKETKPKNPESTEYVYKPLI